MVKSFGSFTPAMHVGAQRCGGWVGSEMPRRCRELRAVNILNSERDGKFVIFVKGKKFPK